MGCNCKKKKLEPQVIEEPKVINDSNGGSVVSDVEVKQEEKKD